MNINNCLGNQLPISFGVPQGSVLGPTLFLFYVNELCNLLIHDNIVSFADDTILLFKSNNWHDFYLKSIRGITVVKIRLDNNTLTMNATKNKYIVFSINPFLSFPENQIKICACFLTNDNICLERATKTNTWVFFLTVIQSVKNILLLQQTNLDNPHTSLDKLAFFLT